MLTLFLETVRDWVQTVLATFHSMYLGYSTPQMFGAKGDGVHDDTEAIQQALNRGGVVYFPAGEYLVTEVQNMKSKCLNIPKSNTTIIGDGNASVLKIYDEINTHKALLAWHDIGHISISNITFRGTELFGDTMHGVILLQPSNTSDVAIHDCLFQNNGYGDIQLVNGGNNISINRCTFEASDCGIIAIGSRPVNNVTIRNCHFTGLSSLNSYVNYSSEPISVMTTPTDPTDVSTVSSHWIIENCLFEHKHTKAIGLGFNSDTAEAIRAKDFVIRNCTFRAVLSAVTVYNSEDVLIDNLYYDSTDVTWSEAHPTWGLGHLVYFGAYNKNCIARNIVSECKNLLSPIMIDKNSSDCLVENVTMYVSTGTDEGVFISGNNNIVRNVVAKPHGDNVNQGVRVINATNCYVDIRGDAILGSYAAYRTYGDDDTVHDNTFIIDNKNGTAFVEKNRTNKTISASQNRWKTVGELIKTGNYTGTLIPSNYIPTRRIISFIDNREFNKSQSEYDYWTLMNDGTEIEVAFPNTNITNGKTFTFPTTGNIIPINQPITFSNDYSTVCKFKQNVNKWVEIDRWLEYADGRIEDISHPDLVTRSEMEQYIQETDTIPTASADYVGKSYLYTGTTTSTYQKGGIYECQQTLTDTYEWKLTNLPVATVKDVVASSSDFADFQSKIALL